MKLAPTPAAGTLPHKKYYDHEAYEAQRAAKAAKKGVAVVRSLVLMSCVIVGTRDL